MKSIGPNSVKSIEVNSSLTNTSIDLARRSERVSNKAPEPISECFNDNDSFTRDLANTGSLTAENLFSKATPASSNGYLLTFSDDCLA